MCRGLIVWKSLIAKQCLDDEHTDKTETKNRKIRNIEEPESKISS